MVAPVFRLLLGLAALPVALRSAAPNGPEARPRLAVVIAIDQFRGDYLTRYRPHFAPDGFRRLLEGGLEFKDCHQRHALSVTAPGHANLLTGVYANVHGVSDNAGLNRETGETVLAVQDPAALLVGITPAELGPVAARNPAVTGRSPRNLRAETIGDLLKQRYGSDAVVFAASNKDRSAILLGGRKADAAYWDENGKIVTSRYYRAQLPSWIDAFNAERRVHAAFGRTWDRLLDARLYDQLQGPDDAPGESDGSGLGRTFPRVINGGNNTMTPAFFSAFDLSPFSAEFLGAFVEQAVREEKLGRHAGTDLLCVSFSQVDAAGHAFGPDSHEVMDSVLRLDRVIARLLACLDREVGLAQCVIVVTADHGVARIPEQVQAREGSTAAGRMKLLQVDAAVKQALEAAYGPLAGTETWFIRDGMGYHFRPTALTAKSVSAAAAAKVAQAAIAKIPFISDVFTRDELLAASDRGDSKLAAMRRSYRNEGDRDVVFIGQPNYIIMGARAVGTSHGTPYDYDTHITLLWHGVGVPAGVRTERVGAEDIAPTLAGLLGIPGPNGGPGRRLF